MSPRSLHKKLRIFAHLDRKKHSETTKKVYILLKGYSHKFVTIYFFFLMFTMIQYQ